MRDLVCFVMGLPGSGKSTWISGAMKLSSKKKLLIDCDRARAYSNKGKGPLDHIVSMYIGYSNSLEDKQFFVDGLFTDSSQIVRVMEALDREGEMYGRLPRDYEVHIWNLDRESCLWNDHGRRDLNSRITIKNARYVVPSHSDFPAGTMLAFHTVIRKPVFRAWSDSVLGETDGHLRGTTWELGGHWIDCYGNDSVISPESAPNSFRKLDQLLEKICPNLTFLQYKKLEAECVKIEIGKERDYYGGSTSYATQVCDLEKLYSLLVEMGYINEIEPTIV